MNHIFIICTHRDELTTHCIIKEMIRLKTELMPSEHLGVTNAVII